MKKQRKKQLQNWTQKKKELKKHDDNLRKVCKAGLFGINMQVFQWFALIHPRFWLFLLQLIYCLVAQLVFAIISLISAYFGSVYIIAYPLPLLDGSVSASIPPSQHWLRISDCSLRISNNSSVSATAGSVPATITLCQQRCLCINNCFLCTRIMAPYQHQ